MSNAHDTDFDLLISRVTDGAASDDDLQSLGRMLEGDSDRQHAYFDWISTHLLLEQEGALRDEVERKPLPTPATRPGAATKAKSKRSRASNASGRALNWRVPLSVAAAAMLCVGAFLLRGTGDTDAVSIATVVDAVGVVGAPKELIAEGALLDEGLPLQFEAGAVSVAMPTGSRFTVEGPALLMVTGANQVKLSQGKLFAQVPPGGVGFTVDTPTGSLVDLGTEFGVDVGANNVVQSYVFRGKVRAESGAESATLEAGRAIDLPAEGRLGRVRRFDEAKVRFTRSIDGSGYVAAIDSLKPLYLHRFTPNSKRRTFLPTSGAEHLGVSLQGGVYAAAGGPIALPEAPDGCLRFVGVESVTEVPSVERVLEQTQAYSVILWCRVDEQGPQGLAAFTSRRGPDIDLGPTLRVLTDGRVEHRCRAADGSDSAQRSMKRLPVGAWSQIVATGNAFGRLNLYINGERAASPVEMPSAIRTDCGRLVLGSGSGRRLHEELHTGPLRGAIDEVAVFDRRLSAVEVQQVFRQAQQATPPLTL